MSLILDVSFILGCCLGSRGWRISHVSEFGSNNQNSRAMEEAWVRGIHVTRQQMVACFRNSN